MSWIQTSAVLGLLGVAIGAFGAHGLKNRLEETGYAAQFQTGVLYHFVHTLALLGVALLLHHATNAPPKALRIAPWMFVGGIVLFSGSLYVLAITGTRWLGAVTPLGGVMFIIGWALLFTGAPK